MTNLRIGHGYDVHRTKTGRKLVLGGVTISCEFGLDGHSDADALIHAVVDAVLGASAMGDIGKLFPDNDPAYAGIDSRILLRRAMTLVREAGFVPVNVDSTILCQRPKLAPYISEMRANLAEDLGLDVTEVSVKATTEEHLGFTGSGDGIAAHAVCLLEKR